VAAAEEAVSAAAANRSCLPGDEARFGGLALVLRMLEGRGFVSETRRWSVGAAVAAEEAAAEEAVEVGLVGMGEASEGAAAAAEE
jgi:hypothetical protein